MRKFSLILTISALAIALFASCQKEVSVLTPNGEKVTASVVKSFEKKYPHATNVVWENKAPYWVAHFDLPQTKAAPTTVKPQNSTWFDNNGNWQMSEHDIDFDKLPQAVQDSFNSSKYTSWEKDDINTLERDGVIELYMIEVEQKDPKTGEEIEMELYYTADGILTKEVPATEDHTDLIPEDLPEVIISDLKARYGEFEPIEAELEEGEFEVEILADGRVYELKYILDPLEWLSTEYDITVDEVPAQIMEMLKERITNIDDYEIDDIELKESKDGSKTYEFEFELKDGLESEIDEIELTIIEKDGKFEFKD